MQTARESMARRVLVMEYARIASAIPGTSRSQTARVASGVTSRIESPVPPPKIQSAVTIAGEALSSRFAAGEHDIGVTLIGGLHDGITNLADVVAHDHM